MSKCRGHFVTRRPRWGLDGIVLDARESHQLVRVLRDACEESRSRCWTVWGSLLRLSDRISGGCAGDALACVGSVIGAMSPRVLRTGAGAIGFEGQGDGFDFCGWRAEIGATATFITSRHLGIGEVLIKGDRLASKWEKWQLVMIEACKQCGLAFLPDLRKPVSLSDYLDSLKAASGGERRIVASLEPGAQRLTDCLDAGLRSVELAVGPEGDFSAKEYGQLGESGFLPARLGANVLRAETAAAYLLSVADQVTDLDKIF